MNGIKRSGDVTVERGITNDYVIPVLRLPIEPLGTIYNFNKNKVIGSFSFNVYRYTRYECNKMNFYCYFGKETDNDNSNTLSTIINMNDNEHFNVYTRELNGYIYIYLRPLTEYDLMTLQVEYASNINFIEFLHDETPVLYSSISSLLKTYTKTEVSLIPNVSNYVAIDTTYYNTNKIENKKHVFINTNVYTQTNSSLADGTVIATVNKKPKKATFFVATYSVLTTQDVGFCRLSINNNGEIKIYGISSIPNKNIRISINFNYYI